MKKRIDKDQLSYEEKIDKYEQGEYIFKAPPVCSAGWSVGSWIRFIDSYNGWVE